jgi:hypothetical protein
LLDLGEDFQNMRLRDELYRDLGELGLHFADAAGQVKARLRREDKRLSGTVGLVIIAPPSYHSPEDVSALSGEPPSYHSPEDVSALLGEPPFAAPFDE